MANRPTGIVSADNQALPGNLLESSEPAPVSPNHYLERALARVVSNFAASPETLDSQFEPALSEFVSALEIERSTVYLGAGNIYSWAKPGIKRITAIDGRAFPFTWATIQEKGAFSYFSAYDLPPVAGNEREYYLSNGPASLLVLPLIAAGQLFGGIAFETLTYNRKWPQELVERLRLVADLFASGLVITQAKESLAAQLRFERCISDISASLVNLASERTEQRITEALRETGEALGLERMSFFKRSPVEEHFIRTHSWVRGGDDPVPRPLLYDHARVLAKLLLAGQTLRYSSLAEMPAEAEPLRTFLETHGVQSFMAIPISIGGRVVAGISVASAERDRTWDSVLIRRLNLLGETLANAVVRNQQDDSVREHQNRLRLAMEASKSHGWDWNIEMGNSVWFGDSKSIFGFSPDGPTAGLEEFFAHVHIEDRDRIKRSLERAIRDHTQFEEEYRIVRNDGCLRWLSDRGNVFYGPDGTPKRMIGIAVDITDRKEAEATQAATETRYGQLLQSVEAIVWRCDPTSTRFTFVSRQAEQILGYPAERWLEDEDFWPDHLHAADRDWVVRTCLQKAQKGEDYALEYRMIAADGRIVWLHDKGAVVMEHGGPVELGVMVDITPLKEAEGRLRAIGGKLIRAQELERSRIARELHDDINQRLALIAIDLERFEKERFRTEKQIRAYSRALWTKTSEVSSLISRLCGQLHSSKLEHLGLVSAVRDLCSSVGESHSIKIDFATKSLSCVVPEDVALCIFRICQESLANVVKHSHCSRAKVKLAVNRGVLELSVMDDGEGFDCNDGIGKGLGLISMQERASLLGGRLTIASAPGAGTAIFATIALLGNQRRSRKRTGATA